MKLNECGVGRRHSGYPEGNSALAIVNGEEEEPPAGNTAAARTAVPDYQKRQAYMTTGLQFSCTEEEEGETRLDHHVPS